MLRIGMILTAAVLATGANAKQRCTEFKGGLVCTSSQGAPAQAKPRCERTKHGYVCGPELRQISDNVIFDCTASFLRDCADRSNQDTNCRADAEIGVKTSQGQSSVAMVSAGVDFTAYAVTPVTAVYVISELGEHSEERVLGTTEVAITADGATETLLETGYSGLVNGSVVRKAQLKCSARLR